MWYGNGIAPVPARRGLNLPQVALPDPEDNLFGCSVVRAGPVQEGTELPESAGTDEIERSDLFAQLLIAADKDAGVRKFKITNDFCKKGGFLHIGFDEE